MTALALLNAFSYVDGYDFTGDTNDCRAKFDRVALNRTNWRSRGWTTLTGGLRSVNYTQAGFWAAGSAWSPDAIGYTELGTIARAHTFGPQETEGEVAWFWRHGHFNYKLLDAPVGQLAPFTLTGSGSDTYGPIRGMLAASPNTYVADVATPVVTSATGPVGSPVQLGALGSTQHLFAAVHLMADVAGADSVTIQIQSDSASNFPSPTNVATIGPLTARGGAWLTPVAGPNTDTWWRFNVSAITTAGGTQFVLAGSLGIQGGWL